MAFAKANLTTVNMGGGLRMVHGTWTGSEGDATGTITFRGAKVYGGQVYDNTASSRADANWSYSSSSNVVTVTVESIGTVTDGHFWFLVK